MNAKITIHIEKVIIHLHEDDHQKKGKKQKTNSVIHDARMKIISSINDTLRQFEHRNSMWDARIAGNANKVADNANKVADHANSKGNEIRSNSEEEAIVAKSETTVPKSETTVKKTNTGKFKTTQKSDSTEKICALCGKAYIPTSNRQLYCPDCKEQRKSSKSELTAKDLENIANLDKAHKQKIKELDRTLAEIEANKKKPYQVSH